MSSLKKFLRLALKVPVSSHGIRVDSFLVKTLGNLDTTARHALFKNKEVKLLKSSPIQSNLPVNTIISEVSEETLYNIENPQVTKSDFLLYTAKQDIIKANSNNIKNDSRIEAGNIILLPIWIAKFVAEDVALVINDSLTTTNTTTINDVNCSNTMANITSNHTMTNQVEKNSYYSENWTESMEHELTRVLSSSILPPILDTRFSDHNEFKLSSFPFPKLSVSSCLKSTKMLMSLTLACDDHVLAVNKPFGMMVQDSDSLPTDRNRRAMITSATEGVGEVITLTKLMAGCDALSLHYMRYAMWVNSITSSSINTDSNDFHSHSSPSIASSSTSTSSFSEDQENRVLFGTSLSDLQLLSQHPSCPYSLSDLKTFAQLSFDLHSSNIRENTILNSFIQSSSGDHISEDFSLVKLSISQLLSLSSLRLVHRLDKDTSGTLLVARNRLAAAGLCDMFKRSTDKAVDWIEQFDKVKDHKKHRERKEKKGAEYLSSKDDIYNRDFQKLFNNDVEGGMIGKYYWAVLKHNDFVGGNVTLTDYHSHPLHESHMPAPYLHNLPVNPTLRNHPIQDNVAGFISLPLIVPNDNSGSNTNSKTLFSKKNKTPFDSNKNFASGSEGRSLSSLSLFRRVLSTEDIDLFAFSPLTGRNHQLRIHSSTKSGLNSCILGDPKYYSGDNGRVPLSAHSREVVNLSDYSLQKPKKAIFADFSQMSKNEQKKLALMCRSISFSHPLFETSVMKLLTLSDKLKIILRWGGVPVVESYIRRINSLTSECEVKSENNSIPLTFHATSPLPYHMSTYLKLINAEIPDTPTKNCTIDSNTGTIQILNTNDIVDI